jgi:amidophosphoribosyltransferase
MSDQIKHECGIAMLRLLKPIDYYQQKWGTSLWGLKKLNLLLEKQHNRGQDGAGIATLKFDTKPGSRYISRYRSNLAYPLKDVFSHVYQKFEQLKQDNPDKLKDPQWLKENVAFTGELYLGHLRYGTFGKNSIENCHPFLRQNNWKSKSLIVAGNFNLTNVDELFDELVHLGQHPKDKADTITVMERIGYFLDEENDRLYKKFKSENFSNTEISQLIAENLNIQDILIKASKNWDGGYVIGGMFGHGDAFVVRDPNGIRPCYYYKDLEVCAVSSERPAIQTTFNVPYEEVRELGPGMTLIIKKSGEISEVEINKPQKKTSCSFERIYFSRGSDSEIYKERKLLGKSLTSQVLEAISYDIDNTVFSYIPNTSETSFYGLVEGLKEYLTQNRITRILGGENSESELKSIFEKKIRVEKLIVKDDKLRTFITTDTERDEMVRHVYDITYGSIKKHTDTVVLIDDSIVRGTTLKQSIITMIDRLHPKKIVVISSAPQIRYPDCYGIDMSRMADFVAFQAAILLLKERNLEHIIDQTYDLAKLENQKPVENIRNMVKRIYEPFTYEEISNKISEIVKDSHINSQVQVIYQSIGGLHRSIPNHTGDWYFSGDYPTPGGMKVVNNSFINFYEGNNCRAYD